MALNCQHCGQEMRKTTQSSGNALGIAIALLLLLVGILLCLTVVGAIIGVPLILVSLCIGGKRTKVWRCAKCQVVVPRG